MTTCLAALVLFMQPFAGMPEYEQGWVLSNKNAPFYTWYMKPIAIKKPNDGYEINYIAAAKNLSDLPNKKLKPHGACSNNGEKYTLFIGKGKLLK